MRRILYAAVNQCLRGMVTGCDNILDNEYKKTLETDLPQQAWRFRSVLDIMVSDRVLFKILLKYHQMNQLTDDQVLAATAASLSALTQSGTQEASEEKGISKIFPPEEILKTIHHYKTGLLFQCPWAVPLTIENYEKESVSYLLHALYQIGIGCQIMDDMVDISNDLKKYRHNYVISLIYHDSEDKEKNRLQDLMASNAKPHKKIVLLSDFPQAHLHAVQAARKFLESGLKALYSQPHRFLVEPSISYISNRIGANRFMSGIDK
ncbi:MAG: polyprenyl synthetase family protein [Deltaproteobacteria bacterium]|nr:MAG: polyprenyl synthetase family protein [Deltaproteobacteria bacterium]